MIGYHNCKPLTVNGVTYPSRAAFCRAHGVRQNTLDYRLSAKKTDEQLSARRLLGPQQMKKR